jgi:uncharacterized protein (DUF2336 family)
MATTRGALTETDIRALVRSPTPEARADAAQKICRTIEQAPISDDDRGVAHEILRIMAADAAEVVRRALAVSLKESPLLPRDVALKLAADVESICTPVLSFSPVFTDADLVEIVRLGGPIRQLAIARRPELSPQVTEALSEVAEEAAMEACCGNDLADFSEGSLRQVIVRFEKSERVLAAIAYRQALPLSVSERLVQLVGEQARERLAARQGVSAQAAEHISLAARERAVVDLVDQAGKAVDLKAFVTHLHVHGRLTPSLLLRALAHGHIAFFEWGVAELASVPHHRTWLMIHDGGPLGLVAIYERAGLPSRLFPAFRAAVDAYHALDADGVSHDPDRLQSRMLERFLSQPQPASAEDIDYLLERFDAMPRKAAPAPERRRLSA